VPRGRAIGAQTGHRERIKARACGHRAAQQPLDDERIPGKDQKPQPPDAQTKRSRTLHGTTKRAKSRCRQVAIRRRLTTMLASAMTHTTLPLAAAIMHGGFFMDAVAGTEAPN